MVHVIGEIHTMRRLMTLGMWIIPFSPYLVGRLMAATTLLRVNIIDIILEMCKPYKIIVADKAGFGFFCESPGSYVQRDRWTAAYSLAF